MDHKQLAINLFNKTWDILDNKNRTQDEEALMINQAHASLYHWQQVGTPLNVQRGEWMISHVYSILKMAESALYHANRCLKITKENNISGFDLTFAYEALARAYSITKDSRANDYLELAYESLKQIEKETDRNYVKSQLDEIKNNL